MVRLTDIKPGMRLKGIAPGNVVTVASVNVYGRDAAEITYTDPSGRADTRLLYRDDETKLEIAPARETWSFDGDGHLLRLMSEARRIRLAYLFDPMLAVHTSLIEPLPHQITAVYGEMLPRQPLRFLLADDPGSGKTIMAGLLIKELLIRGDIYRCLVICPGMLVEQWQDELFEKFHLPFDIVTNEGLEAAHSGNWFQEHPLAIARLDKLSRDERTQEKLLQIDWDLVIVDEAHKMAATHFSGEVKRTLRYRLGEMISGETRHFLLMTATPHNGHEEDFQLFMALLDPDRFEGRFREGVHTTDTSDLMRRMVKEGLVTFEGKPLFPERIAYTVPFDLSDPEADLYAHVTEYVRREFNRAEALIDGKRRGTVGFALTILQRRLASSPEAIYRSLKRRRERLQKRLEEERRLGRSADDASVDDKLPFAVEEIEDELDDAPSAEIEEVEDRIADQATAAQTIAEFEAEIETLETLEMMAWHVRNLGTDRKWEELTKLLEHPEMFGPDRARRKLVIFTEHRDTLEYLARRIRDLLGRDEGVVFIHGGMQRADRHKAQELFTQDPRVHVLVATDAAGEGINLQRAHLMVNYDLPWNPNRIEQRFGRIHRIGQTEVCHLWNLVAKNTREGDVYHQLLTKLEGERQALGGAVFDVLGRVFEGKELRELLVQAIRYGDDPEVRARLNTVVDTKLDHAHIIELIEQRALANDTLPMPQVQKVREDMERAQARRLQPHYVASFFIEAFGRLGGTIRERESKRYEITHVPAVIRNRGGDYRVRGTVLRRYERITFEKELIRAPGKPLATFVSPGQPLLDATIDLTLERDEGLLKRGAILVDPDDESDDNVRFLCYLEHAIRDSRIGKDGNPCVISRQFQFVEIDRVGNARQAGPAPYLDYEPLAEDALARVTEIVRDAWPHDDLEAWAKAYAITAIVPGHLAEVRGRRVAHINKTKAAVHDRLTKEIMYWDRRAQEMKAKEDAGQTPRLNSQKAQQRADELQARLEKRMAELERELDIAPQPPIVVGGALIVPIGLVKRLRGDMPAVVSQNRKEVERRAMQAVMDAESALGFEPADVSERKIGYDVESRWTDEKGTTHLRFIEVKGRGGTDAPTVTVTRNEILTALNKPDNFILAIVRVDGDACDVRYLRRPFEREPDFSAVSVNYDLDELFARGEAPA